MSNTKRYLIECMDIFGYDTPCSKNEKELILAVKNIFLSEKACSINEKGKNKAAEDWLRGMCSSCTIECSNFEIEKILREWGVIRPDHTDNIISRHVDNWWSVSAVMLIQLFDKAG